MLLSVTTLSVAKAGDLSAKFSKRLTMTHAAKYKRVLTRAPSLTPYSLSFPSGDGSTWR